MEYTEDADRRELLLHSAYDSDTVRAMERPLLDKGVPLMRMAAQADRKSTRLNSSHRL